MNKTVKKALKIFVRYNPLPLGIGYGKSLVPILRYHSVDETGSCLSNSYETWRMHLSFFKEKGIQVISLRDYFERKYSSAENIAIMTFDDGFRNNYTYVFRDLQEMGYTATFFIVPEYVGLHARWIRDDLHRLLSSGHEYLDSTWEDFRNKAVLNVSAIRDNMPELIKLDDERCLRELYDLNRMGHLALMSWEEIKVMSESGMDIGAHTLTHSLLGRLSVEDAEREIHASKMIIEDKINSDVKFFCYPYGNFENNVSELVKSSGFTGACSCRRGYWSEGDDPFHMKRIEMEMGESRFDLDFYLNPRSRMLLDKFWRRGDVRCA